MSQQANDNSESRFMGLMTRIADKTGALGSVVSAMGCAACFPALASFGAAIGLGFLSQYEGLFISRLLPLFAALLTAADKLGMQYVATTHRARVETGADGVYTVCPPAGTGSDDSTILAALPQETLARLILPLGDFAPEDVAEMAEDFKV